MHPTPLDPNPESPPPIPILNRTEKFPMPSGLRDALALNLRPVSGYGIVMPAGVKHADDIRADLERLCGQSTLGISLDFCV
jgi:hypothetical protein